MPSEHDPRDCPADIVLNIERTEAYMAGMDAAAFAGDDRTRDAVERCLERICEAAHRLGQRAPVLIPDQPPGPTSPGRISAAWETGCDTPTIGSV